VVEHLFDPAPTARPGTQTSGPAQSVRPDQEDEGMAAVISLRPAERAGAQRVAAERPRPPRLVVIEGGRSDAARRRRGVFLRRRLVVAAAALVLVCAAVSLIGGVRGGSTAAGSPGSVAATRLVRPGDTLWGIAESLHRGGDVRGVVDRLAEFNGTDELVPGQLVKIPTDLTS
jgi:nucleoid-associated protein YgaU